MTQRLAPTPGQTIGPFFHYALPFDRDNQLVPPGAEGSIRLHGTVRDGAGSPVPDALIEIWQTDSTGAVPQAPGSLRRDSWVFTGWGRCATDNAGYYSFSTVTPGPTEPGSAPFFAVTVFARGLMNRLFTRAYVPGDADLLVADRLLASLDPERRERLISSEDVGGLRFDIHLQGDDETVFLRYPGH